MKSNTLIVAFNFGMLLQMENISLYKNNNNKVNKWKEKLTRNMQPLTCGKLHNMELHQANTNIMRPRFEESFKGLIIA